MSSVTGVAFSLSPFDVSAISVTRSFSAVGFDGSPETVLDSRSADFVRIFLKVENSPFFGVSGRVGSISATSTLGSSFLFVIFSLLLEAICKVLPLFGDPGCFFPFSIPEPDSDAILSRLSSFPSTFPQTVNDPTGSFLSIQQFSSSSSTMQGHRLTCVLQIRSRGS